MKISKLLFIFVAVLLLVGLTHAQTGNGYDLTWNTIDNGGGVIGNGGYTLNSTIGQPDASASISNGGYSLAGGFWNIVTRQYPLYLPLVLRGS